MGTVSVFFLLFLAVSWQQQSVALVNGQDVTTTISITTSAPETTTTNDKTGEANDTTKSPVADEEDTDNAASAKPEEKPEEAEEPDDDSDSDPWADDDEKNIVDQMRELREKDENFPITRNVSHLNETFDRMRNAWEIIDQYYLPKKETWDKLMGLVTGLDLNVSPECVSSYFKGTAGFTNYEPWAYRCMLK